MTSGLTPYSAYRDSRVEWLGKVPAHWGVARLKSHLIRNDSGVWGDNFSDTGTVVLRSTEQTVSGGWRINNPAKIELSPKDIESALLETGDLVVTKSSGSLVHIGKTSLVTSDVASLECCFSNFMQRLRVDGNTLPVFIWYNLNSRIGREQLIFQSTTTTGLGNLNGTILANCWFSFPPLPEQTAIVRYLDYVDQRVRRFTQAKQKLVALLKEQKQVIIHRAVTRGLDPHAPMKDSGVEWLGKVPAHWGVLPGRACFYQEQLPNTGMIESTVLSLSYGRIVVKPTEKLRGLVPISFETYQIINPGDIICRSTDLQNDHTSLRFGITKDRGIITSAYMCLKTKGQLNNQYGYLMLHAYDLNKVFYGLGSGLRQNLNWEDFKYLPLVLYRQNQNRPPSLPILTKPLPT